MQYYIYSNKKIETADLSGLKLRIAPIYRDFFQKLNASVVQIAPGEVYTALERGVVDGYGWPLIGIFDLGWHEKTKYRVEPGFYAIELGVVFNANTWRKLTPAQREFLEKQGAWLESLNAEMASKDAPAEIKKQQDAGIQVIKLPPREGQEAGQDGQRCRVGRRREGEPDARPEVAGNAGSEVMESVSAAFGKLFDALAALACVLLFLLMIVVCADVLLRNVPLIASMRGFAGRQRPVGSVPVPHHCAVGAVAAASGPAHPR